MMTDDLRGKLNDFVDDALSADEVLQVEALMAVDAQVRAEVAFLRQLTQDALFLSSERLPERDLWPGVAGRLAQTPAFPWHRWARHAAAAILLVTASSAVTVLVMKQTMDVPIVEKMGTNTTPVMAAFQATEQTYSSAIAQLTETFHQRKDALAPETISAIESNLKVIDDAIHASRMALDADPNNQASVHLILAMYKRKVDLLQQIVGLFYGG